MQWLKLAVSGSDVEFDRGYFSGVVTASTGVVAPSIDTPSDEFLVYLNNRTGGFGLLSNVPYYANFRNNDITANQYYELPNASGIIKLDDGLYSGSFQGNGSALTGIVASAAPGGPNRSVQFNDAGATSGSSAFTFDKAANTIQLTGSMIATSITASLQGSASYATTASYAPYTYIAIGTTAPATPSVNDLWIDTN